MRNCARLWPPFQRTSSPSRQAEMPTRIGDSTASDPPAVIRPMEDRLSLPATAVKIARLALTDDLRHVPANRPPSSNLPRIVRRAAAHVVAAIPLEPAARVLRPYPPVSPPHGQRLGGVDAKVVQAWVTMGRRKPGVREPARRKLVPAVGHVLPAKDTQLQQLLRGQFRLKPGREVPSDRFRAVVDVALLHAVAHGHANGHHAAGILLTCLARTE